MTDCTECKYFISCDLGKQAFYKITGTPCKEFKKEGETMAEQKIKMKINRYIKTIGENDLILDNGSCIQVVTQNGACVGFGHYACLGMSKKLFRDLKTCGFIFVDEKTTKKANAPYQKPWLTYYRFDIDRMIKSGGYEVVTE